jgi:hypothetical protein
MKGVTCFNIGWLILCSTLSEEAAQSLGKASIAKRRVSIYSLAFLRVFYAMFMCNLLVLDRLALTGGNKVVQAAVDEDAPGI